MGPRKPRRPKPKKRTKRGPKLDPKAVELMRWWQETEKLRHP